MTSSFILTSWPNPLLKYSHFNPAGRRRMSRDPTWLGKPRRIEFEPHIVLRDHDRLERTAGVPFSVLVQGVNANSYMSVRVVHERIKYSFAPSQDFVRSRYLKGLDVPSWVRKGHNRNWFSIVSRVVVNHSKNQSQMRIQRVRCSIISQKMKARVGADQIVEIDLRRLSVLT